MSGIDARAQVLLAVAVLLIVAALVVSLISDEDWAKITAFIITLLGLIFGGAAVYRVSRYGGP